MTLLPVDLYERCLVHHREVEARLSHVVKDSIPIPFFGDVGAYLASRPRILTAALNPSLREFPVGGPKRFDREVALRSPEGLEGELSRYFQHQPYAGWFQSFEAVLNGAAATYGGRMPGRAHRTTALHLDLCSPIATDPTWSGLTPAERSALVPDGRAIFEMVIEALQPDLVIASVGVVHLQGWWRELGDVAGWPVVVRYETTGAGQPMWPHLIVRSREVCSPSGHRFLFANGTAAEKPFGKFTNGRKAEAGAALRQMLQGPVC